MTSKSIDLNQVKACFETYKDLTKGEESFPPWEKLDEKAKQFWFKVARAANSGIPEKTKENVTYWSIPIKDVGDVIAALEGIKMITLDFLRVNAEANALANIPRRSGAYWRILRCVSNMLVEIIEQPD